MLCRYCTHEAYSNTQSVISSLLWNITLKYLLFNCIKVLTTTHEYESTDNVIKCKFEKNKLNKPTQQIKPTRASKLQKIDLVLTEASCCRYYYTQSNY